MTFSWLTVTYELIGAIGKFIIIGIKANSASVRRWEISLLSLLTGHVVLQTIMNNGFLKKKKLECHVLSASPSFSR